MSGPRGDWSSAPARESGHVDERGVGREARPTSAASAPGRADGRVHGTPAPEYGEYAPAGWVNPVLVEQERQAAEEQRRDAAQRQDADTRRASDPTRPASDQREVRRTPGPDGRRGSSTGPASGSTSPYGASRLDFLVTVGLLATALTSTLQSLAVSRMASAVRQVFESRGMDITNPGALSTAAVVSALVTVVVFVLVTWWSVVRLRARRWTFWVPLLGGIVAVVVNLVVFYFALTQGQTGA